MNQSPDKSAHTTRQSLLLRLRDGGPPQEVAWSQFHKQYAPIIRGFALRLGAPRDDADDLVQEVLRAFYAVSPEFVYDPAKGRFRGYLKTCVWNKLAEMRRRFESEGKARRSLSPTLETDAHAHWDDAWETEKLNRALAVVRKRYEGHADRERTYTAFEMTTILGRPTHAVARALDMSEQSVRAAKSRVARALRQTYEQLEDSIG